MRKKTFAALALSATLAMGAVPAFAEELAEVGTVTDQSVSNGGTTSTTVKVKTEVGNIVVALPLNMTIVANTEGGQAKCPSQDAYLIQNKSVFPIKITAAKAEAQGTPGDWVLKTGTLDGQGTPTGNVGDLALKLTTNETAPKSWFRYFQRIEVQGRGFQYEAQEDVRSRYGCGEAYLHGCSRQRGQLKNRSPQRLRIHDNHADA